MLQYFKILFLITILLSLFSACTKSPDFSPVPHLEFKGMNKSTMKQGSLNTDSLNITLYFTDGDGDIGVEQSDSLPNLFIIDSRTGNIAESIKLPKVSDAGFGNGISGIIELKLYTTCCLFTNNIPPCSVIEGINFDTLNYKIYLIDKAGNKSETVETNNIILECK